MFKKSIIVLILFLTILAGSICAQEDDETPKTVEYIIISESNVNLREGPGTNYAVVDTASPGDSLLVYDETPEVEGWLRVNLNSETDAYVADFLVERAPMRFYPVEQEPIFTASGQGTTITEVYEIPKGAYRLDAVVQDSSFILKSITVEGDCDDKSLFNELDFDSRSLNISTLFISEGCSVLFEADNVDGTWEFALRDILDVDILVEHMLIVENGTTVAARGRALTMPTLLGEGIWTISAIVEDNAFILHPQVLTGDCDGRSVFNELDFDTEVLEISTVYRSKGEDGCIIFWQTDNVEGNWELLFEKLN